MQRNTYLFHPPRAHFCSRALLSLSCVECRMDGVTNGTDGLDAGISFTRFGPLQSHSHYHSISHITTITGVARTLKDLRANSTVLHTWGFRSLDHRAVRRWLCCFIPGHGVETTADYGPLVSVFCRKHVPMSERWRML